MRVTLQPVFVMLGRDFSAASRFTLMLSGAVPTLLYHLPDLGQRCRVRRLKHREGCFWHVVYVRVKKDAMNEALATPRPTSDDTSLQPVFTNVSASGDVDEPGNADTDETNPDGSAARNVDSSGLAATAEAATGTASEPSAEAADGTQEQEDRVYVGPSGFTVKHREFSAHVYGVFFRYGVPKNGLVKRIKHAYKHDWVLSETDRLTSKLGRKTVSVDNIVADVFG